MDTGRAITSRITFCWWIALAIDFALQGIALRLSQRLDMICRVSGPAHVLKYVERQTTQGAVSNFNPLWTAYGARSIMGNFPKIFFAIMVW